MVRITSEVLRIKITKKEPDSIRRLFIVCQMLFWPAIVTPKIEMDVPW